MNHPAILKQKTIDRRTMLRGVGGILIGLPFLEEMAIQEAFAKPQDEIPPRAFNVFFGLGIPAPLQTEGFEGVLEPLAPLRDHLLIMREVDQIRCDESGINAHFDGSSGAFTAEPPFGEAKAGGPSIDQVIRNNLYPDGLPNSMVSTLVGGTFFRRSRISRYIHSYNYDGTVAAAMQEKPRDLFNRVFGRLSTASDESVKDFRISQSVLDSVVGQYKRLTGPFSPLGSASKGRIRDHLDRIREYEQRAFAMNHKDPNAPPLPPRSRIVHGGEADPGGEGIDITVEELVHEWRLMADLYALAIKMDRVRFGSITFLAAGERIRLTGDYEYAGRHIFTFDDAAQHNATGSKGCSHEWWHQYNPRKRNEQLRAHAHLKMREVAYFLNKLNDADAVESNGKTILDNALFTISTESGDGRHNDVKRELSGVFHAITSANGRFKTGQTIEVGAEGLDLYNTILAGMGVQERLGPAKRENRLLEPIKA